MSYDIDIVSYAPSPEQEVILQEERELNGGYTDAEYRSAVRKLLLLCVGGQGDELVAEINSLI